MPLSGTQGMLRAPLTVLLLKIPPTVTTVAVSLGASAAGCGTVQPTWQVVQSLTPTTRGPPV